MAVACSGGRDSVALLHATLAVARPLGLEVLALHVHHGLSPNADAWQAHCADLCERWARAGLPVRLLATRLTQGPQPGMAIEAWARRERYRALREMALAHGADTVLLAHHRRDQAETWLLQALRGGGVKGLAAMPASAQRDGVTWLRPWLARPRSEIEAYVARHRLPHIEDESNADPRFARNRLRLQVWPALSAAFPEAEAALAASAAWAQEAMRCLDELAAMDVAAAAGEAGLRISEWSGLSAARRSNSLRAWLKAQAGVAAPASLVERLMAELPNRRSARWLWDMRTLRLYRGVLRCESLAPPVPQSAPRETTLSVSRAGRYRLAGWNGCLQVRRVAAGGVPLAWLAHLELHERTGGEQFQIGMGRPPRSLKKQYQAAGVPEEQRTGPLVYSGGQLIFVPGLGLDARAIGLPGQPQVSLHWSPAD